MGIQGLLPFLKKIHAQANISQFEGCTVAIDAYCWLHKGAFSCAEKLALGEKTDQYVYYCMKYLEFMLKKNIKPIMVFDGCHLPSKKDVEKSRREKRDMNRKKAAQLLREGRRAEARECLQRCIDISPEMALQLMNTCRDRGIDCIVAPYEADAQLAYLNKCGIAQVIITEDSDLLLFGCEKVMFKMDHFGNGVLIEQRRLNEVLEIQSGFFTFDKFRHMCILSGCDYLPSLPGIGLAKACKVFKTARQTDLRLLLKKFPSTYLKMSLVVTDEYIDGFIKADNTFLYQLAFDPLKRKLVPLNPYPPDIKPEDVRYAGPYLPHTEALQIALGNINIYNKEKFANFDPDLFVPAKASNKKPNHLHFLSMWNKNYRVRPKISLKESQNLNRPNLQGKEVIVEQKVIRRSPKKRQLHVEEEVEQTGKTDAELLDLYNGQNRNEKSPTSSPKKKKFKNDENSPELDGKSQKRRSRLKIDLSPRKQESSSEEEEIPSSPVKRFRKLYMSPDRVQFFDSLKAADRGDSNNREISVSMSPVKAEIKQDTEDQELVSPKRNKFAVLSGDRRQRFNINAAKTEIVKSRFFATDSDVKVKPTESSKDCNDVQIKECTSSDAVEKATPNKSTDIKTNIHHSNVKTDKKCTNSPLSSFSWSKFKSTKSPGFNRLENSSSAGVKSQFKKVVSESSLKSYFSNQCKENSEEASQKSSQNSTVSCDGGSGTQLSQQSYPCSIDTFCMTGSEEAIDTDDNGSESIKNYVAYSNNDITLPSIPSPAFSNSQGSDSSITKEEKRTIPQVASKKGCKVSGLSKGKKGKLGKSGDVTGKQQSLKDMFSRFANNKSVPKLTHDQEEDVEILSATPSMDDKGISLKAYGGIQRQILP